MEGLAQDEVTRNLTPKVKHNISKDWLISYKDPITLWEEHWFALALEVTNAIILYKIFRHAKRKGNEPCYLVLASMFTAICFELLPLIPQAGYQLWWYHQGMVNIVNRRVPSYVISTFAIVHYVVYNLTRDSNLPLLTRSLVTGLCGIAMYCPLLWLAPRLLLTLIHFDDVVFKDSIFGVPCIQILFMFFMFLHTSQVFIPNYRALEDRDRSTYNLVWCSVQSGLVAAIYAVVEQYVLYILITLICRGHTGLCILAGIAIASYLAKAELKSMTMKSFTISGTKKPLTRKTWWAAACILVFASTLPIWLNIHSLKSNGNRLELGPCHIKHDVSNTSPLELPRRRFICPRDGTYLHFDFHCVNSDHLKLGVQRNASSYTICGKALKDPHKTAISIGTYSVTCLLIFYNLLRLSFAFESKDKIEKDTKNQ